ncbi:F-box only protein 7 isoform X2 [Antennarius striatus]|uniref:F-box only protein 7 isoform X2 n=1 Tax=Antennarius striatus TaxID=241820 RepID=UPI0035B28C53
MKLRVRVHRQTRRVELPGADPSVRELMDRVRETVLSTVGLSADTEFCLSLNGSEPLSDPHQSLSASGVVSGDLICVLLPQPAGPAPDSSSAMSTNRNQEDQQNQQDQQRAPVTSHQSASGRPDNVSISGSEVAPPVPAPAPGGSGWEPMMCGEAGAGHAPLSLELLYSSAHITSPSDAIVVVGNLLMLETGFTPQGEPAQMPAGWRSAAGVYRLQYAHPLCGDSVVMLLGVAMGPLVVLTGESAAAAFRDLSKLSRVFKDQLAYPLIAAARDAMALPVAFGLAALPLELLLRILRLLDVGSLGRVSSVSRHLHAAASDSTLWRHLFHRDFKDPEPSRPRDTDWKEVYKRFHKSRSHFHWPCIPSLPHFAPPLRDIYPNPFFPVPGILGGEYDQWPHLPRPRHDPIGPPLHPNPDRRRPPNIHQMGPRAGRSADVRRGFI